MKKIIFALLFSIFLSNSAIASTYSQTETDCSKNHTFIEFLQKNSYNEIIAWKDKILNANFVYMVNLKNGESVMLSVSNTEDKVCLISIGDIANVQTNRPLLLSFFDKILKYEGVK
jgi:hypothetical protein